MKLYTVDSSGCRCMETISQGTPSQTQEFTKYAKQYRLVSNSFIIFSHFFCHVFSQFS